MPEPAKSADLDRPLEWWEEVQVNLWIRFAKKEGFSDIAEEAKTFRDNPRGWREMRDKIHAMRGSP